MNLRFLPALLAITLSSIGAQVAQGAEPPSAKDWLKGKVDRANALANKRVKPGTPEEEAWRTEAKSVIDDVLDWETMTRESLGSKWKELKPAEQQEFSTLLREIIEASYQSKLKLASQGEVKKPANVKIDWVGNDQEGDKAKITAKVKADKTNAQLEFSLLYQGDRWRVWDIAIDDVSTVRTYRSQFRKHIAEKGFPGLLELMHRKIKEIREGKAELNP